MVKKQLGMVQVSNASPPQEVEAGGSEVQSLLQLYRELQVSLGYTRPNFNQSVSLRSSRVQILTATAERGALSP